MADNHDALASFMSITGASSTTATQYLDLTNWALDEAVNLFMESGGQAVGGDMGGATLPPAAPMAAAYDDDVRAPDPSKRQRLFGDAYDAVPIRRLHEQYRDFAAESIAAINAMSTASAISPAFGEGAEDANRSRDLGSLFQPPVNITFQGSYSEARTLAKNDGKYLLVNIQDEIVFASHMLNRDTWSDDIVQNVVSSGYVFWQHYWVSEHGKKFCTLYQIERESLPIIAIIDPKTGSIVRQWKGFMEAPDLIERLSDFSFQNAEPEASTTPQENIMDVSEDDQLAAAIAASLEGNDGESTESDKKPDDEEEKAEEPPAEEVLKEMPPEPTAGPDVTRVQIRAPNGARLVRRFLKDDPVSLLFRFVKEQVPEARTRGFELRVTAPPATISGDDQETIATRKLENASLMINWV